MDTMTLEVKKLKNGFEYMVKEGETVVDTRKSSRVYVAVSVYYRPEKPAEYLRPLYHGKLEHVGKGDGASLIKAGYRYKVATVSK